VVAGVLLVPDDRILAGVVIAAGGHRLVAPLVRGRPVAGFPGPVARLTVGGALALTVPRPLVLSGIAALTLAASVRPVHFPTPFRCRAAALSGHAAGGSLAIGCYHYPGRRRIHMQGGV
jgi:hypothetical protein